MPKVIQAIENAKNYRWIARDLDISKSTVADVVKGQRKTHKSAVDSTEQ